MKVEPSFNLWNNDRSMGESVDKSGASGASGLGPWGERTLSGQQGQGAAHRARREDASQDPRCGTGRIRAARVPRQLDRRHHQPGQGRAGHLLHLFRQQGGGVRGAGPRHVAAGARSCRSRHRRRDRRDRSRAAARLASYLRFVFDHKEVYRIIDEAEFVDPAGFRTHYETAAARIAARLEEATAKGANARRRRARHGSPRLGDHGDERLPRPALRRVGQAGPGPGRRPRQRPVAHAA